MSRGFSKRRFSIIAALLNYVNIISDNKTSSTTAKGETIQYWITASGTCSDNGSSSRKGFVEGWNGIWTAFLERLSRPIAR
jgi:hypothetical protein